MFSLTLTLALASGGGCATTQVHGDDERLIREDREIAESSRASGDRHAAEAVPVEPSFLPAVAAGPPGTLLRADVRRVLAASPAAFLAHVDVEPAFADPVVAGQRPRFAGWRLRSLFAGDARFAAVDLRAGDVVFRINGKSVERPEQFIEVWQALNTRKDLVIEYFREGRPRTVRWAILE